jgi:hypothetical protein
MWKTCALDNPIFGCGKVLCPHLIIITNFFLILVSCGWFENTQHKLWNVPTNLLMF